LVDRIGVLAQGVAQQVANAMQGISHRPRIEISDLVEGFETPFGLELLSTIHWVASHEGAADAESTVALTYAWNDRKKQFSTRLDKSGWHSTC
jgi:hypothetical protein